MCLLAETYPGHNGPCLQQRKGIMNNEQPFAQLATVKHAFVCEQPREENASENEFIVD